MKIRNLHKQIAGLTLGLALVLGIGIGSTITAHAQDQYGRDAQNRGDRSQDQYGNYGGSAELRQTALNAGYNEGVRERNNGQSGRRSNYQNSSVYQKATAGYNRNLGDRELYRRYFREAFVNGFNANGSALSNLGRDTRDPDRNDNNTQDRRGRNWDRYGSYGGSYQLRQTALNAGYNEGIKQGRNDRSRNRTSDFRNQGAFQKATQDYSSRLGDRELYRRYYREGFENGYTDGSNGG
jgi:hypothetical protein